MEKDVINILIVDDEKYEGILMEKSVAWESEGISLMGNVQCAGGCAGTDGETDARYCVYRH